MWESVHLFVSDLLTSLSLVAAVCLGAWGYLENRRALRVQHTMEALSVFQTSDVLSAADFQMTRLINQGVRVTGAGIPDDIDRHVIHILDYYEFIAASVEWDVLDRDTVLFVRGGAMARAYDVCRQYIIDRRETLNHPSLYSMLEGLVEEQVKRDAKLYAASADRS